MISPINNFSNNIAYPAVIAQPPASPQAVETIDALSKKSGQEIDPFVQVSSAQVSDPKEGKFSEEDLKKIAELKRRDQEVRTHEQAHQSAAGSLSNGGASFEYESGPDGKRYAVGGEVSIDTSKVANDPQATIAKARQIRRAALAPADPSGQDRQVAAQAVKMEAEANKELASQRVSSQEQGSQEQQGGSPASKAINSYKTDFYQQIQASISQNSFTGQNNGVSRLDYYA